jgi:SAM-dependent methyltransferase
MSLAHNLSARNREQKWRLFLRAMAPTEATTILNVGYSNQEYSPVDNYIEKRYAYLHNITSLGIEEPSLYRARYPNVRVVTYSGGRFPFADKAFDVCFSNAVIEHVGDRERQLAFLREIVRVSRRAFVTTPSRYFPVEVHTRTPLLHYLPKGTFDAYLRLVGKRWAAGDYMNLLSAKGFRRILEASGCAEARIVRNRLFGLTVDFVALIDC